MSSLTYILVSPVKDEVAYVERTLSSVVAQTILPKLWLIVDDGSTDGTRTVVERFCNSYPFIRLVRSEQTGQRGPGSRVIQAFNRGYSTIENEESDLLVKLDCDLSFDPGYFEGLIGEFERNPKLGIASGIYLEQETDGVWKEIGMPEYHSAGASKVVRRACFQEIGGFVASRGWDTVDEIRAMARGWECRHFPGLKMKHWKREGSGIGTMRTNYMHGEVYYLTGGGILFYAMKVLHRMFQKPYILGGIAMFWGFARTFMQQRPRLVTSDEARLYRSLLNSRLFGKA